MFVRQEEAVSSRSLTPNVRLAEGAVSSKAMTPNSSGLTCSPTPNARQAEEAVSSHLDT
jgi:hypothetical protein